MKIKTIIIILLIIISGILYYIWASSFETQETKIYVTRIIDGDTFESNNLKFRLKGINAPEKTMLYHEQSKQFLKNLIQNKSIKIKHQGVDKYNRILSYAFINNKLVNKEILKNGLAHLYYYEKDSYYSELENAEKSAKINQKGIWKKSPNSHCIKLVQLKSTEPEKLILQNNCKNLNITIKDEATHIYHETLSTGIWEKNFSHIWNNDGDSLFIWDDEGLVLFFRY